MITTNYTNNNYTNFKAKQMSYEEMGKVIETLVKNEKKVPKEKNVSKNKNLNIGQKMRNAADTVMALGYIVTDFTWNRIKTLLLCLWTIPGILAFVTGGSILIQQEINKNRSLERLDKKAVETEQLYDKKPKKYYEKINSVMFDYCEAIEQLAEKENELDNKINTLKDNRRKD